MPGEAHDDECNKNACLLRPIQTLNRSRRSPAKMNRARCNCRAGQSFCSCAMASLRQHWRATNRHRPFSRRRAAARRCCVHLFAHGEGIRRFGPAFAPLLVSCVQSPALSGLAPQNAGSVCDQKTIGARIVNGANENAQHRPRPRSIGRSSSLRGAAARRVANGKREVPELELEEVEIKATSNEGHTCELT
ncbi:hypothetical protein ACVMIH_007385 [Bradyrhizobium sp. USDA 4503]